MLENLVKFAMKVRVAHRCRDRRAAVATVSPEQVYGARRVVFSFFTRFGDGVIGMKVAREFMLLHRDKEYLVIISPRLKPYAELIFGDVELLTFERNDLTAFLKIIIRLKKFKADLGLEPQNYDIDSQFFISFARVFCRFKKLHFESTENHYQKCRIYTLLKAPSGARGVRSLSCKPKKILVVPESTESYRSIAGDTLVSLLARLRVCFPESRITIALASSKNLCGGSCDEIFYFTTTQGASEEFIALLKDQDLLVSADSGPLHIADALGIPAVGLFGPSAPAAVLDHGSLVLPLRHPLMRGAVCFNRHCIVRTCINEVVTTGLFDAVDYSQELHVLDRCPFKTAGDT